MSEEMIIDGVNVAECDYILSNLTCIHKDIKMKKCIKLCANIPNCHYKQLQRLKQENERLASNYENLYQSAKQLYNKYNKFEGKKENELVALINRISDLAYKYKQALEEIREIAKYNQFYDPRYFMMRGDIGQVQNTRMTEIYEKCNEALND